MRLELVSPFIQACSCVRACVVFLLLSGEHLSTLMKSLCTMAKCFESAAARTVLSVTMSPNRDYKCLSKWRSRCLLWWFTISASQKSLVNIISFFGRLFISPKRNIESSREPSTAITHSIESRPMIRYMSESVCGFRGPALSKRWIFSNHHNLSRFGGEFQMHEAWPAFNSRVVAFIFILAINGVLCLWRKNCRKCSSQVTVRLSFIY